MNITKLFEIQKILRDRINYNEPDRFNKLILALLVELGECANEWRGFKFWSVNQLPHTSAVRTPTMMEEDKIYYNPMLEEYVDGLHFILELGLEINFTNVEIDSDYTKETATETFIEVFRVIDRFVLDVEFDHRPQYKATYEELFNLYVGLAEKHFSFTWEQIEQAYIQKNEVNHLRQDNGY